MEIQELGTLRWLHIVAMVYWLGGEWGVFQTAYNVMNPEVGMDERKRHLETAYRIDILARTGIIALLPLGLHMGYIWGIQPYGGGWITAMWISFIPWFLLCWAAFYYRETDRGIKLTLWDERIRYVVIPVLMISAITSLLGYGPFNAGPMQKWFSIKVFLYGFTLIIGLHLRFVMREWTMMFRRMITEPESKDEIEGILQKRGVWTRREAYVYWVTIISIGFLCATKPL
ncbi:MAG: hypothetical protein V7711_17975 [Pseudomonadales bacterium]